MEWQSASRTVVVPDALVDEVVALLAPSGLVLDPYRDTSLASETVAPLVDLLRSAVDRRTQEVRSRVLERLRSRTLPEWGQPALASELAGDELMGVLTSLLELSSHAASAGAGVRVLGR